MDESFLFANFEEHHAGKSKSKKSRKRKLSDCMNDDVCGIELPEQLSKAIEQKEKYILELEDQNNKLKSVIKRLCGPQSSNDKGSLWEKGSLGLMPMAAVLFLSNELSVTFQKDIEEIMINMASKGHELLVKDAASLDAKSQPSAVPLRAFAVDTKGKRTHIAKNITADPYVYSSVHYYIGFCIDRLGLPLLQENPSISESWSIPVYEQVFFSALPAVDDDGRKVFIKQKRAKCCFNCLGDHTVSECDRPRDQAKIDSNRQEFLSKFGGSPVSDSRYHQGEQERFREFKPGVISENLREALMIQKEDLPPYIYKMRHLGYPPGYLKSKRSGLLMYGKEGKIQDSYDSEEGEIQSDALCQEVQFPGFNAPIEEGVIDRSFEFGMQPFEEYYAAHWNQATYNDSNSFSAPPYQQNDYGKQANDDMEVEDTYSTTGNLLPSQIEVQPTENSNQIMSSPGNATSLDGTQPPLPDYTPEKAPPPPSDELSASPLASSTLTSIDIGELLEKAEMRVKKSKVIDMYLAQGSTAAQSNEDSTHRSWWDHEPLSTSSGILYLTYTPPPTIQRKVDIADIFKYTANDLDREPWKTDSTSWYDPLYGDLSAPTGTYDAIKEILKSRKERRQGKKSL